MLPPRRAVLLLGLPAALLLVVLLQSRSGPTVRPGDEPDRRRDHDFALVVEKDPRIEAIDRRMVVKREVIQELIAGRRTLEEVAAFFATVDANDPSALQGLRFTVPGR